MPSFCRRRNGLKSPTDSRRAERRAPCPGDSPGFRQLPRREGAWDSDHVQPSSRVLQSESSGGPRATAPSTQPAAECLRPLSAWKFLRSPSAYILGVSGFRLCGASQRTAAVLSSGGGGGRGSGSGGGRERETARKLPKQFSAKSPGVCVKDKIVCPRGKYS